MSHFFSSPVHKPPHHETLSGHPPSPPETDHESVDPAFSIFGHHADNTFDLHAPLPPSEAPGGSRIRKIGYQHSGIRESRDRTPTRNHKFFVVILPPPSILTDHGNFGHTLASGPQGRLSSGILLPLFPTMYGQLTAIAREFNFPSITGLCLYLHFSDNGMAVTPRIADETWPSLWGHFFEGHSQPSMHLPVVGRIEFDIDIAKARWYSSWISSSHRDHVEKQAHSVVPQGAPGAHMRQFSKSSLGEHHVDEDLDDASTVHLPPVSGVVGRHVPRKLSLLGRLERFDSGGMRRSVDRPTVITTLSPPDTDDQTSNMFLSREREKPKASRIAMEKVNSWRASATFTASPPAEIGHSSLELINVPKSLPVDEICVADADAHDANKEVNLEDYTWSISSAGPASYPNSPVSCTSRHLSLDITQRLLEDSPPTPSIVTSWGPPSIYPASPDNTCYCPSIDIAHRQTFSRPVTPSTATSWGPPSWTGSCSVSEYSPSIDLGQRTAWSEALTPRSQMPRVSDHSNSIPPFSAHVLERGLGNPLSISLNETFSFPKSVPSKVVPWVWPYFNIRTENDSPITNAPALVSVRLPYYPNIEIYPDIYPCDIYPCITIYPSVPSEASIIPTAQKDIFLTEKAQLTPVDVRLPAFYPNLEIYTNVYPHINIYPSISSTMAQLPAEPVTVSLAEKWPLVKPASLRLPVSYPNFDIYPMGYPHIYTYPPMSLDEPAPNAVEFYGPRSKPAHLKPVSLHLQVHYPCFKIYPDTYPFNSIYPPVSLNPSPIPPSDALELEPVCLHLPIHYPNFDIYPKGYPNICVYPSLFLDVSSTHPSDEATLKSFSPYLSAQYPKLDIYPEGYPHICIYPSLSLDFTGAPSAVKPKPVSLYLPVHYPNFDICDLQSDSRLNVFSEPYPNICIYPSLSLDTPPSPSPIIIKPTPVSVRLPVQYPNFNIYPEGYPNMCIYPSLSLDTSPSRSSIRTKPKPVSVRIPVQYPNFNIYPQGYPNMCIYPSLSLGTSPSRSSIRTKPKPVSVRVPVQYPNFSIYPEGYPNMCIYPSLSLGTSPSRSSIRTKPKPVSVCVPVQYPNFSIYPEGHPNMCIYPPLSLDTSPSRSSRTKPKPVSVRLPVQYPNFNIYPEGYPKLCIYPSSSLDALPNRSSIITKPKPVSVRLPVQYPDFNIYSQGYPHICVYPSMFLDPPFFTHKSDELGHVTSKASHSMLGSLCLPALYPNLRIYPPCYPSFEIYPYTSFDVASSTIASYALDLPPDGPQTSPTGSAHYRSFELYYPQVVVYPFVLDVETSDFLEDEDLTLDPSRLPTKLQNHSLGLDMYHADDLMDVIIELPDSYPTINIYSWIYPWNLENIYPSISTAISAPTPPGFIIDHASQRSDKQQHTPSVLQHSGYPYFNIYPAVYPAFDIYPAIQPSCSEFDISILESPSCQFPKVKPSDLINDNCAQLDPLQQAAKLVAGYAAETSSGHCFYLHIRVNFERPSDVKIDLEPRYPIMSLYPPVYPHFDLYYSSYSNILDKESKLNSEVAQYPAIELYEPLDSNSESALSQCMFTPPEPPSEHKHADIHAMVTVEMQKVNPVGPGHAAPMDDKSIPSLLSSEPLSPKLLITASHAPTASHGEPLDDVVPDVVVSLDKSVEPPRTRSKSRGLAPAFPLRPMARHSFVAGVPSNSVVPPGLQRARSVASSDLVVPPLRPIRRSPVSPYFTSPAQESPRRPLPDIPESADSVDKPEVSPPPRPIRRLPAPGDPQLPPLRSVLRHSTLPRRPLPDVPSADLDRRRSEFIVAPAPDYQRDRSRSPNQPHPGNEFDHIANLHGGKLRPRPRDSLVLQRAKEYDTAHSLPKSPKPPNPKVQEQTV